jgi:hypothetical protein
MKNTVVATIEKSHKHVWKLDIQHVGKKLIKYKQLSCKQFHQDPPKNLPRSIKTHKIATRHQITLLRPAQDPRPDPEGPHLEPTEYSKTLICHKNKHMLCCCVCVVLCCMCVLLLLLL